jgi:hypothetical protein
VRRLLASSLLVSSLALPLPLAGAAQAQAPWVPGELVRTYLPQELARFAPRTALEMLQMIPGFVISDTESRRGLGSTTENILINGRVVSGKFNDGADALRRIGASEVARIEIRTSGSGEAGGVGRQIANVVVQQKRATNGQFTWRPSARLRDDGQPAFAGGDASVSSASGPFEYTLGLRNDALRTGASGPSRLTSPDGDLVDVRDERFVERSDRPRVSGDLRFEGAGGLIARLRGSYQRYYYRFREQSDRSGEGLIDRTRFLTQRETDRRYELGGDLSLDAGPGRLKLIGLDAAERSPIDTRVSTIFSNGSDTLGDRFVRDADEQETVFRAEYRWAAGPNEWQVAAERALSRLDNVSSLFELLPDGSFEEVLFPGGTGKVRELRHEASVTLARRLSPGLSLQASLGGEISRLGLAGPDDGGRRRFTRPKGYVSLAWQAGSNLRATAKIERRVGQISFFDFLASRDLSEDRENAANPQLVPPQSWDVQAELSRDLAAFGTTTLRVYGQRIEDLVDRIPIGLSSEAPGNLDTAYLYGVDWKTTLLLDRLGLTGVRFDSRLQFQGSSVDDPVTGRSRRISNNLVRLIDLSMRHDIAGTKWAWGGGLYHIYRAPDFRIGETARYREGPLAGNLFVENKDVAGLTVRTGISNLISSRQELDRFVFVDRKDGPLLFVERRRRSVGPVLTLAISGNF